MLPDDALAEVEEQARRLGPAALVRAMDGIGQALIDMRDSVDPRVTLEVALVRLARPDLDSSNAALLERIERLERAAAGAAGAVGVGGRASGPPSGASPPEVAAAPTRPRAAQSAPPGRDPGPAPAPAGRDPGPPPRAPAKDRQAPAPAPAGPTVRPALGAVRGAQRGSGPPASGAPPAQAAEPTRAAPQVAAASAPAAPQPSREAQRPPSRDELTKAWGDGVLRSMSGRAKAYLGSGRFLEVNDREAIFAVPDKHLLARGESVRTEAETALAAHFGRRIPLQLVLDPGAKPIEQQEPAGTAEDPTVEEYDLADLEDAPPAVASPEQRLLDAFPGAEEVST